jgi:acetoin utilization protein AcuB
MLVEDVMTPDPFIVDEFEPIERIAELIQRHRIHQVPVVDDANNLIGIVTDRDIRTSTGGKATKSRLFARDVMTSPVVAISPAQQLTEAVSLLCHHRFGALPVVVGDRVVGILSTRDLLRRLLEMLEVSSSSHV